MREIIQTPTFKRWLCRLEDRRATARINLRLSRVAQGNLGDVKSVGDGVFEMRIPYGPGYRVYYMKEGRQIILLLCGGDKSSQPRDIPLAKQLAADRR